MSDLQKIYRNGDWVLYRDYKALADRIEQLAATNEELEAKVRELEEYKAMYEGLCK
jgi:cell division protein FtsB